MTLERLDDLKEYVARTKRILDLSSPQLDGIQDAESYREVLLSNFEEIKSLADKNIEILNEYLSHIAEKNNEFSDEDIEVIRQFVALLMDTTDMECMDLPLIQMQTERILEAAEKSNDLKAKLLAYDEMVASTYMMLNLTIRLYPESDMCFRYRDKGLEAGYHLLDYLDKEKFEALPDDECKEIVLINSRYIRGLFDWLDKEDYEERNEHDLSIMRQSLSLDQDPFYLEKAPNYNWINHRFRALQYSADFTEYNNSHRFNEDQLKEIASYTKDLITFIKEHPELEEACSKSEQKLFLLRNTYLAKEISKEEYKEGLKELLIDKDKQNYSARGMFLNFIVPFEFILVIKEDKISEEEYRIVDQIYNEMTSYVYHMPKSGTLSFMLTFLIGILKNFIEVPGGMSITDFCLKLIAAIHPITYVHTVSVARIAAYLTKHLIQKEPEHYLGILDTKTIEEVKEKEEEITETIYKGCLVHDVGKLFIIETIITYGRNLLPEERELIHIHPSVGADLLALYPDTAPYVDAARGHHKWFNNEGGYPSDFNLDEKFDKIYIHTLTVADCLDAATDRVGRNYKLGKSLSKLVDELEEGSGTRYAPYLVQLIREDDDIYDGLLKLITQGRVENYRSVYQILKEL